MPIPFQNKKTGRLQKGHKLSSIAYGGRRRDYSGRVLDVRRVPVNKKRPVVVELKGSAYHRSHALLLHKGKIEMACGNHDDKHRAPNYRIAANTTTVNCASCLCKLFNRGIIKRNQTRAVKGE